jgi:uncharacterized protein (TIGR02678 family)
MSRRRVWTAGEANEEAAACLRALMVRPWLVAGRDDDLIAAVRRNEARVKDVCARLGWVLVVEPDLVRLRKTPPARLDVYAAAAPSPLTCSWFFLLAAAAESQPARVGLGALVTAAREAAAEAGVSTTGDVRERRAIIAALRLLDDRGVIERMDGELDTYVTDESAVVLLAIHHTRLVQLVANWSPVDPRTDPAGFLAQVTGERDPARRMRRRLVDDTLVHTDDLDPDEADWLSRRVRGDDGGPLADALGLHLERRAEGAAFVVPTDAFRLGRELGPFPFPSAGTVPHAALLVVDHALDRGDVAPGRPGWRSLPGSAVVAHVHALARDIGAGRGGWAAEDVEDPTTLTGKVATLLTALDLARLDGPDPATATWWFSPAVARWSLGQANRRPARTPDPDPDRLDLAGDPA